MNVMYASDDNYAEIMGVSILSLLESNKNAHHIKFFIVEDEICEENRIKLQEMVEKFDREIEFIKKPDISGKVGIGLTSLRWSDSTYSRLFLQEVLASHPEVHKILYLDCDTLIVGNLQNLWNKNITDFLGAACLECMSNLHKRIIGIDKTDNYINAGMMLLNVDRWIEEGIQQTAIDFIRKYKGKTEYVDQGVINGIMCSRFLLVDPRYNLTSLAYDFTYKEMQIYRKPQFGYSEEIWNNAIASPVVIHFTTSFLSVRPWFEGSRHPYAVNWKLIHDRSPWSGCPYRVLKNRRRRDRREAIFRKIPRDLAVQIAGFLHAYIKPILYKFM